MRNSLFVAIVAALASSQPAAAQVAGVPVPEVACDRDCLEGWVDRYLVAMAEGGFDEEMFDRGVRFTENGVELPLGNEGLWATMTGLGTYQLYVPDIETQQIGFLGTVRERLSTDPSDNTPENYVGLALRLRIANGNIVEVEQIVARPDQDAFGNTSDTSPFPQTGVAVEALGSPNPAYLEAIPEAERHSRAELVEVSNAYFQAVERNTGDDYYPFTDDCIRYENGTMTAGPPGELGAGLGQRKGCREQLETSLIDSVSSIRDRRIVAVDRERGVAFAFAFFDHRPINWTWQLGELFKIEDGQISRIEAIFIRGPYGMCSGWSTQEMCRSEAVQDIR